MNTYIQKMGVDTSKIQFCEVLSLEDWALDMVPKPVQSVIMLYPIKDASEAYAKAQQEKIDAEGQVVSENVKYTKQTIGNACGTIGILHALSNVYDKDMLNLQKDSYLSSFLANTAGMNPLETAEYLNNDEELEKTHTAAATEGQTGG